MVDFAASFPDKNFVYSHATPMENYVFDMKEVKAMPGEMPINSPSLRSYLKEMIDEIGIVR